MRRSWRSLFMVMRPPICLILFPSFLRVCSGLPSLSSASQAAHIPTPFDIRTDELAEPISSPPLVVKSLYSAGVTDCTVMSNEYNKVKLKPLPSCKSVPAVEWGPPVSKNELDIGVRKTGTYKLFETHFYWPSPFAIDGVRAPLAIGGLFYNVAYDSPKQARDHDDGTLVFLYSIAVGEEDNQDASHFFDTAEKLKKPGTSIESESRGASEWFTKNMNCSDHASFLGASLVTYDGKHSPWNYVISLLGNVASISERQFNIMKSIEDENGKPVEKNMKELQEKPPSGTIDRVKSTDPTQAIVPWEWTQRITESLPTAPTLPSLS